MSRTRPTSPRTLNYEEDTNQKMKEYVKENSIVSDDGLRMLVYKKNLKGQRTGYPGCTIVVHYTGTLTGGRQFDTSRNGKPFEFVLGKGQVINGWDQAFASLRPEEKAIMTIPPKLAYGDKPVPNHADPSLSIPPNSTLVFDVEVIDIILPKEDQ